MMTYQQWCHQKASQVKGHGIRYNSTLERNAKTLLVLSQSHQDQPALHVNQHHESMKNQRLEWKLKYHQQLIRQNQLEEKGNVVIVDNMDITGENDKTIGKQ